jgi:hypothetical protein
LHLSSHSPLASALPRWFVYNHSKIF